MYRVRLEKEDTPTRQLIAGDAAAQAVESLIFMALHDEFQFGAVRLERIFNAWGELSDSTPVSTWEQFIAKRGYNGRRLRERFVDGMMRIIAADKIKKRGMRECVRAVITGSVIVTMFILCRDYGFRSSEIHRLEARIYNYVDILLDPLKYGVTIWRFMASLRYELNIRCDILSEFEKSYERIDLGPKWGINMVTGKPRKKNEPLPETIDSHKSSKTGQKTNDKVKHDKLIKTKQKTA